MINGKIETFTYTLNKEHKCEGYNKIKKEAHELNTEKNILNAAKIIIIKNKEKTLGWHINNFKNLNIILSDNQIKRLVYEIKDSYFPKDEEFLKNISLIKITYDANDEQLTDNNFCFAYNKYINPSYHNREEKFIIYTSIFLLKKLEVSELIYIDATFRTSPKNFYLLLNIIVKDNQSGLNIPVIHVPMSHKSEFLYLKLFETINQICLDFNIKLNMNMKTCITDFEKGLRKILRNLYERINLRGCYFHYVKALWSKAKKLGLCGVRKIQITKLIIFGLKVLTLQSRKCQEAMIKEISHFVDELEDNSIFKKFISY